MDISLPRALDVRPVTGTSIDLRSDLQKEIKPEPNGCDVYVMNVGKPASPELTPCPFNDDGRDTRGTTESSDVAKERSALSA